MTKPISNSSNSNRSFSIHYPTNMNERKDIPEEPDKEIRGAYWDAGGQRLPRTPIQVKHIP